MCYYSDSDLHVEPRRVGHLEPGPATKFPRCIRVNIFIISNRKNCFQQKLNQQIFNAIIGLFTYYILIVKSGYIIETEGYMNSLLPPLMLKKLKEKSNETEREKKKRTRGQWATSLT